VPKTLNRAQVECRKEKAARFVRDVLGDPDRADEIEDESLEEYAERHKTKIVGNPQGAVMATKDELLDRISDLEEENDELQDQLDKIADLAAPIDEDEDQEEDNDRPTVANPPRRSLTGRRGTERTRRRVDR